MRLEGSMQNLFFGSARYNQPESQELDVEISCTKQGYALGNYIPKTSYYNGLTNIKTHKYYRIDNSGFNLNITTADTKFVKGTFVCNLIDGTTKIPATSSFSLKKM